MDSLKQTAFAADPEPRTLKRWTLNAERWNAEPRTPNPEHGVRARQVPTPEPRTPNPDTLNPEPRAGRACSTGPETRTLKRWTNLEL